MRISDWSSDVCSSDLAETELPRYAQPPFIEIVPELPKTPTAKVQKAKLRDRDVGPGTWDRGVRRRPPAAWVESRRHVELVMGHANVNRMRHDPNPHCHRSR